MAGIAAKDRPGRFLRCVVLYGVVVGSIAVGFSGPVWGRWALLGVVADVGILGPLLGLLLRRTRGRKSSVKSLLVLLVWLIAPSAWLWCVIRLVTGSWIWATAVGPVVSYLVIDFAVWRFRRKRGLDQPMATDQTPSPAPALDAE